MNSVLFATESAFSHQAKLHWHQIDWRRVNQTVRGIQRRIAKATQERNWRKVKALQRFLTRSFCAKALAVRRVTENQGRNTPGVDGELWRTPTAKRTAVDRLTRRGYRAQPLRRVYIPKKKGKQRPLGIPALIDRAMQALYALALLPVAESTADSHSYGFRPERCTADAIGQCFIVLSRKHSVQWVLEGDIKGCFDHINHDWLLNHIPLDKTVLRKWLTSGVMEKGQWQSTEAGTPQGGIVSPLLANMALDGLQRELETKFGCKGTKKSYNTKVNLIRYADDFIITGISQELLEEEVKPLVKRFLQERGLTLSEEKTRITSVTKGFDFLGWGVRKIKGKLLIKPAKANQQQFRERIRQILKTNRMAKQSHVIRQLNPLIRGWCNYHKSQVASQIFSTMDNYVWQRLWRWARRRHLHKSSNWVKEKYFHTIDGRKWTFAEKVDGKKGKEWRILLRACDFKISRHTKIKAEANPFDPAWELYFEERRNRRMLNKLQHREKLCRLWRIQGGKCSLCDQPLTQGTGWHTHHLHARVHGGDDKLSNLVVLHPTCHQQVHHQRNSVEQLAPVQGVL